MTVHISLDWNNILILNTIKVLNNQTDADDLKMRELIVNDFNKRNTVCSFTQYPILPHHHHQQHIKDSAIQMTVTVEILLARSLNPKNLLV